MADYNKLQRAYGVKAMLDLELGFTNTLLLGGAPRDLMMDQEPRDWDYFWCPFVEASSFTDDLVTGGPVTGLVDFVIKSLMVRYPREEGGEWKRITHYGNTLISLGHYTILGLRVNVILAPSVMAAMGVDWDCCQLTIDHNGILQGKSYFDHVLKTGYINLTKQYRHMPNDRVDFARTLKRGQEFERRYGWTMNPIDVAWLESMSKDVEEEVALLRGFRVFNWISGISGKWALQGAYNTQWVTPEQKANCHGDYELCERHLLAATEQCSCGLYCYKELWRVSSYVQTFHGSLQVVAPAVLWGAVAEYRQGYRSQWARMEALYVLHGNRVKDGNMAGLLKWAEGFGLPVIRVPSFESLEQTADGQIRVKPRIGGPDGSNRRFR